MAQSHAAGRHDGGGAQNVGGTERMLSAVGGAAMVIHGLSRRTPLGLIESALGAMLLARGTTGRCALYRALGIGTAEPDADNHMHVQQSVTVNAPAEALYREWRRLDNLPRLMKHVRAIEVIDDRRSRWTVEGPGGATATWESEITSDHPNERIGWRTLGNSDVDHAGTVRFNQHPGGRATEIVVTLNYTAPGGRIGRWAAEMLGTEPGQQIAEDLRRFKERIERGDTAGAIA